MRWWFLLLLACRPILVPVAARVEIFVDASAPEEGDGSRETPFKRLGPALKAGALVHVATGLYAFTGTVPDLELEGPESAVLSAEGDAPFVLQAAKAKVVGLSIQGGQWGVESSGEVELTRVHFSGQRKGGVHVVSGRLSMSTFFIEGTLPDTVGIRGEPGTKLDLQHASFKGALKRAIDLQDAEATITGLECRGPRTAIHAVGGKTTVSEAYAERGAGPAFFVAHGHLELRHSSVIGHEYGVTATENSDVLIEGLRSEGAAFAAVSFLKSTAVVKTLVTQNAGSHGAVESLEGTTTLDDVKTSGGSELGIFVRHGTLTATHLDIRQLGGEGDAIHVRDAHASFDHVKLDSIAGFGVVSTAVADVKVHDLECTACAHGALLVERLSALEAKDIRCSSTPAATVGEDGRLTLENLDYTGGPPAVWAECTGASKVIIRGRHPARALLSGACIETP